MDLDLDLAAAAQLGCPIKLTGTPANVYRPPPLLGEHDDEIRAELARRRPEDGS